MSALTNELPRFAVEGDKIFDYLHNRYLEAHGELEDGESTWHLPTLHRLISEGKQTHDARTVPPSPQTQALIEQLSEEAEAAADLIAHQKQELQDAKQALEEANEALATAQARIAELEPKGDPALPEASTTASRVAAELEEQSKILDKKGD